MLRFWSWSSSSWSEADSSWRFKEIRFLSQQRSSLDRGGKKSEWFEVSSIAPPFLNQVYLMMSA